jgi:conjugative relaxase-like TrwC/TraI family protein
MLRVIQSRSVNHARSYFSTADYYSEGRETIGLWRGEGARLLGLEGTIDQKEWEALCENRDPRTGENLTARQKDDRTVGYDFNFHVPKGVSLLYARSKDERIIEAFQEAMNDTMHVIEEEMQTRVRKNGKKENRTTSNMVWGEYIHLTARPVDGIPDPLLHGHCYVFNATFDDAEDRWKAGNFRNLKRDAPYYEALFNSQFAHRLDELGLPIERTAEGWELQGIDRPLIEKFSRRSKQIDEWAMEKGITDPDLKAELGAKTREHKQKHQEFDDLRKTWDERMTEDERRTLDRLAARIGGDAAPVDPAAGARALEHAQQHVFAKKSVVPERQLLAEALWHSVGRAAPEQIQTQYDKSDLMRGERFGRRMVTSREVLDEEQTIIKYAREGRGTCKPFARNVTQFQDSELTEEQQAAVKGIVESRDALVSLRGAAGAGKTRSLTEAARIIEESGTQVFAFAPSADASRRTLREAGFEKADTVATLLVNEKLQRQIEGQLIWIDEAGMMDAKTTRQVLELADRLDARVLLSGDRFQHGSVARGDVLRMLETEAGIVPFEINEIQRQQKLAYREAIQALSEHDIEEGYKRLDELGWIKELPYNERYKQIAADYLQAVADGKSALVVSPRHIEAERVTEEIRRGLKLAEEIGDEDRPFVKLQNRYLSPAELRDAVNYQEGDVIIFHQNARGFTRGDRLVVTDGMKLPLDQADRFQVFRQGEIGLAEGDSVRITAGGRTADDAHRLETGSVYEIRRFNDDGNIVLSNGWVVDKGFGHLSHAYVSTSHSSQGKTYQRVFIAQGRVSFGASSKEQFYVSTSRGTEQVTIYTEDKQELLDAVNRSEDRVTATEFVNALPMQHFADIRKNAAIEQERQAPAREELVHDR